MQKLLGLFFVANIIAASAQAMKSHISYSSGLDEIADTEEQVSPEQELFLAARSILEDLNRFEFNQKRAALRIKLQCILDDEVANSQDLLRCLCEFKVVIHELLDDMCDSFEALPADKSEDHLEDLLSRIVALLGAESVVTSGCKANHCDPCDSLFDMEE